MAGVLGIEPDGVGLGEEIAFEQLYQRWRPQVERLCRRLLGRSEDAEDAAQEAFLRAWLAWEHYSPTRPFWPWMATIAQRLCLDWRRRPMRASALGAEEIEATETPERVVELAHDLQVVVRVVDGLRPAQRRALLRRQVHGWSYQQIAVDEGVTIEAVRGSLKRARASVRQSLAAELPATPRTSVLPVSRIR